MMKALCSFFPATTRSQVAAPYVIYPQARQMTSPVAPPSYEQVVQGGQTGALGGIVNPNYNVKY